MGRFHDRGGSIGGDGGTLDGINPIVNGKVGLIPFSRAAPRAPARFRHGSTVVDFIAARRRLRLAEHHPGQAGPPLHGHAAPEGKPGEFVGVLNELARLWGRIGR